MPEESVTDVLEYAGLLSHEQVVDGEGGVEQL